MTDTALKRLLLENILDSQERALRELNPRVIKIQQGIELKAQVVIGVRRAGKSSLLELVKQRLLSSDVNPENIVQINFFDERLNSLTGETLGLITEAYYEHFPEKKGEEKAYFFFDELQEIPGWELFIERLLRTELCEVFISGSSANLLSRELASQMGGRALSYELFPLSFKEFLAFKNVSFENLSSKTRLRIQNEFGVFFSTGGFPELLKLPEDSHRAVLQEYFHAIVNRDVILRHNVRHPKAVKDLAEKLIAENASLYTTNRLYEFLRSIGHKLSKDFVTQCLEWLEDAYCLFSVYLYDSSLNKRLVNPRKIYCIDIGLVQALSVRIQETQGRLLENLVFLYFRTKQQEVFYYKTKQGYEVDFAYLNEENKLQLVQVSLHLESQVTKERELRALKIAMQEQNIGEASLVTLDDQEVIIDNNLKINVIPAWRFLLGLD